MFHGSLTSDPRLSSRAHSEKARPGLIRDRDRFSDKLRGQSNNESSFPVQ
jgi:hypothetical protein